MRNSPFKVFRRNQRLLMVLLTGMAMFAFILLDQLITADTESLFPLAGALILGGAFWIIGTQAGRPGRYAALGAVLGVLIGLWLPRVTAPPPAVATVAGDLTEQDLTRLLQRRRIANQFVQEVFMVANPPPFANAQHSPQITQLLYQFWSQRLNRELFNVGGGQDLREDVVLAFLLRQEAAELGISVGEDAVVGYIKRLGGDALTAEQYRSILKRLGVPESELLDILKDELTARLARDMLAPPIVRTPDEYWRDHQKLNVSQQMEVAAVPVQPFAEQLSAPGEAELRAFFEEYKELPPTATSPGFFQPRKAKLAYLEVDAESLLEQAPEFTEEQIVAYYEEHKDDLFRQDVLPEAPRGATFPGEPESQKLGGEPPPPPLPEDPAEPAETPKTGSGSGDAAAGRTGSRAAGGEKKQAAAEAKKGSEETGTDAKHREPADPSAKGKDKAAPGAASGSSEPPVRPEEAREKRAGKPKSDAADSGEPKRQAEQPDTQPKGGTRPGEPRASGESGQARLAAPTSTDTAIATQAAPAEPRDAAAAAQPAAGNSADAPAAAKTEDAAAKSAAAEESEKASGRAKTSSDADGEESTSGGTAADGGGRTPAASSSSEQPATSSGPPEVKYRPLDDELKAEIRDILRQQWVEEEIKRRVALALQFMQDLGPRHVLASPDSPDYLSLEQLSAELRKFAEQHGLHYEETPLLSYEQLLESEDYPIGRAIEPVDNPFEAVTAAKVADQVLGTQSEAVFQPLEAMDPPPGRNRYVYWVVEYREPHIPTFDEPGIREEVERQWRLHQARPAARGRAEQLAEKVREGIKAGRAMAEVLKDEKVTDAESAPPVAVFETPQFTWLRPFQPPVPRLNPFENNDPPVEVSPIPGIDGTNDAFMEAVFGLPVGGVGTVVNADQTAFYVVHVTRRSHQTAEERQQLLDDFLKSDVFRSRIHNYLTMQSASRLYRRWVAALQEKYAVRWHRSET